MNQSGEAVWKVAAAEYHSVPDFGGKADGDLLDAKDIRYSKETNEMRGA
jgi:hypothetical protein